MVESHCPKADFAARTWNCNLGKIVVDSETMPCNNISVTVS